MDDAGRSIEERSRCDTESATGESSLQILNDFDSVVPNCIAAADAKSSPMQVAQRYQGGKEMAFCCKQRRDRTIQEFRLDRVDDQQTGQGATSTDTLDW